METTIRSDAPQPAAADAGSRIELPERRPVIDLAADPWSALGCRRHLSAALPGVEIEHLVQRGALRHADLARAFLERHLAAGRWLLHGAGTHSRRLLPGLEARADVELVAVVDKLASTFTDGFEGHPVIDVREAARRIEGGQADGVLLSNEVWESSMRALLMEAGVPTERIQSIYSDPRYARAANDLEQERLADLPADPVECVLVDFERPGQQVIDDSTLASVLEPTRTLRLASERFAPVDSSTVFQSVGFGESVSLLVRMLQRLAPRVVYLRTFIEDNPVGAILRRALPQARHVHELYDWSVAVEPRFLRQVHGHDARSLQRVLAGELSSARDASFLVSKRGGPAWAKVEAEFRAPHGTFFPQLQVRRPPVRRRRPGDPVSLVYAGNLPAPNTLEHEMVGALFPLFELLTRTGELEVGVFNGMHRDAQQDATYAPYRERANRHLRYHRALPYDQLVGELEGHDYGWLYFPRDGIDFADERVLISNKFTGYLCAGLPVIVDDGWEYMASLVERFGAGVVHPMRDPEGLAAVLRGCDPERHRGGARALRDHMLRSNERVLERLRVLLAGTPADGTIATVR